MLPSRAARPPVKSGQAAAWASAAAATWARRYPRAPAASTAGAADGRAGAWAGARDRRGPLTAAAPAVRGPGRPARRPTRPAAGRRRTPARRRPPATPAPAPARRAGRPAPGSPRRRRPPSLPVHPTAARAVPASAATRRLRRVNGRAAGARRPGAGGGADIAVHPRSPPSGRPANAPVCRGVPRGRWDGRDWR